MKTTWTTALVGAALLAGCTTGGAADPIRSASAPPSSAPSTSPTTATATTSAQDAAAAGAEEVLRAYYRSQTTCLSDPSKAALTCFDQVAIGTALTDMRNALVSAKAVQTRASGDIDVVSASATKVDLANSPTKTPPVVPQVAFQACIDVSMFNVVDKNGKSIVPADRKPRSVGSVVVANYKYPDPTQWRVAYIVQDKAATC